MEQITTTGESERAFLQQVASQRITTYDGKTWAYFDSGRRRAAAEDLPPLVCLPGESGSARCFHRQLQALAAKGYRVIAVQYPVVWTHEEWIQSFDRFLDALDLNQVHLYGVSLGAYLAQRYAGLYPRRVLSMVLTQPFYDPGVFGVSIASVKTFCIMPEFYLKRYALERFPKHKLSSPALVQAVDYMVDQLDSLSQQELASRLTLLFQSAEPASWWVSLPGNRITILDSHQETSIPSSHYERVLHRYPNAKRAMLRDGGFFPFVSHHDEVSMHLQVHLRANGAFIG